MDQTGALLALVTSGVAFGDAAANFVVLARGLPNPKPQIDTLHALVQVRHIRWPIRCGPAWPTADCAAPLAAVQGGLLFNTSHRLQAAFMLQAVEPAGAHAILCALAAKQSELPAVRELALQLLGGGTDSVAHMTPQQFIQHCATQSSQEQSSPSQPSAPVIVTAEQSATTLATSLSAAAQGPLLPARQQACLALLHQQVDGLPDGALGAAQFVSIAEHNPALAAEVSCFWYWFARSCQHMPLNGCLLCAASDHRGPGSHAQARQ